MMAHSRKFGTCTYDYMQVSMQVSLTPAAQCLIYDCTCDGLQRQTLFFVVLVVKIEYYHYYYNEV